MSDNPAQRRTARTASLSVIVPTRNEAANVEMLVERLREALSETEYPWEVLFVDDSDDDTSELLRDIGARDPRVRAHHRNPGERPGGLSGAVLSGFALAAGDVLLVMDGDLQHPPTAVPRLVEEVLVGGADIAIGSRYVPGGSAAGLGGPWRLAVSRTAGAFTRLNFPRLTKVSDPMAGFFALRRSVVSNVRLEPDGFKVLLEILIRGQWSTLVEIPIVFEPRLGGASKAGAREGLRFLNHVRRLRRAVQPSSPPAGTRRQEEIVDVRALPGVPIGETTTRA